MSFFKAFFASVLGFFVSLFLLSVVGLMLVIGIISSTAPREKSLTEASVLTIELPGHIPEAVSRNPIGFTLEGLSEATLYDYLVALEDAKTDPDIVGLRIKPGSFSGTWAQAEELQAKLTEVRKAGKFIYMTAGVDGLDEKQYMIATAADSIIVDPSARIEMNGITAILEFYKPLLDRLNIQPRVVRAGSYKSAVEPFLMETASPENREMMTSIVQGIFQRFKSMVMTSRKLSGSEFETVVNEKAILTGSEAVQARLVDAVMYEDEVRDLLRDRMGLDDSTEIPEVSLKEYMNIGDVDFEGGSNQIAVVYATGGIISGVSRYSPNPIFGGDMVGSETFTKAMREVRENERIQAVVVRVESPGGDANASEAMWREVELTRKVKPVIISMAGVAASGGYFLAAAGDVIVAEPTTLTGSIGVFYLEFDLQQFFRNKIGINTEIIETNPQADMFVATDETGLQIIGKSVDTTYERFLNVVAQGRKLPVDSVRKIAQGRVWTGEQAAGIGLVDVLGGLDTAIAIAAKRGGVDTTGYRVRIFPQPPSMFELLTEVLEQQGERIFASRSAVDEYQELVKSIQESSGTQARVVPFRLE